MVCFPYMFSVHMWKTCRLNRDIHCFYFPYVENMSFVVRKPAFCLCQNKDAISFAVTAKLISAFVFATRIVQSLYYLNPKFQASINFLWLYSPVCVGPGRKPRRPVFSQRGSYEIQPALFLMLFSISFGQSEESSNEVNCFFTDNSKILISELYYSLYFSRIAL